MSAKKKKPPPRRPVVGLRIGHAVLKRNEDAMLLYAELEKFADALGIGDVRLLDKRHVYDAIEADPNHPMRALGYDWDDASAARQSRIEWTGKLITGLRVVTFGGPMKKTDSMPVYYYASNVVTPSGNLRSGHVHRDQLSKHDPSFVSVVNQQIEQIKLASTRLGHILRCNEARRKVWPAPWDLDDTIVAALETFSEVADQAAEE